MKTKKSLSKLVGLGVALTMLFAPFTSQARTNACTTPNLASPAQETQPESFHKVIAQPGVLDTSQEGIILWHDYGAFALYKVSPVALNQLPRSTRAKIQVMTGMDNILLDAYPFNTQTDTFDTIPERFQITQLDGPALHLIQFVGPIKDAWLQAVEETGAKPVHYIANYGYLVWADSAARARLDDMANAKDFLQFSALYQPYFKLGSSLEERLTGTYDPEEIIRVTIQMYNHPGKHNTERLLSNLMREQLSPWTPILEYQNVTAVVRVGDLETIAKQPDVFWIGEYFERELLDEVQNQILAANFDGSQTGPAGPGYLAWLAGYGFSTDPADYPIVDITDDGIGNGTVNSGDYTLHEFGSTTSPTRLQYVGNCTSSADGGGTDGHGHINTSIVGGYDTRTGFPYQDADGFNRGLGVSPYTRLAGTRIFDASGFDLSACGNTDTGLIKRVQDSGAQIASNSWGCRSCAGSYDDSSQAFDAGVRDADLTEPGNQELIFVFSAGNAGPSAGTVGTPGNGKNMITVGASENDRPFDEGGAWTDGCGVGPTGADNAMDVIDFSSRGPAPGGRVKPEVIAPGTHIQGTASTHPSYNGTSVCDQYRPPGQTIFAASSGTSHSAPAVAGVSSLYYYWLETEYDTTPSPALMKAYLIAHPTYLTGTSANDTLPSNSQGYGMPNMALAFDDTPRYIINQTELFDNTGETWTFSGNIVDPSKPVRVVLVYTDEPGAIGTSPEVNNLNLEVVVGANTYLGNNFSGQWSVTGGSTDSDNNYEAVFLPAGTNGQIGITITAFNIAGDGVPNTGDATDQDFALVIYNVSQEGLGHLDGTVYNGSGTPATDPISGADVQATGLTPTHTGHATSLVDGTYQMGLLTDTYTVTVTAYGYQPAEISGVSVVSGTTTTLNIPLTLAAMYVVSGTVTDATTGWPLYAGIGIPGYPGGTVWTDPETGFYSVTLPEGAAYTFNVNAWSGGYGAASRSVGPLTANTTEDFALTANLAACIAPGYTRAAPTYLFLDDFESGMGNWTLTGLWNAENETDPCGSQVAPFPSSSTDAYYGQDGVCNYDSGTSNTGSLQMSPTITLPASGQVWLSFWSYEHTENSSVYDRRSVEINVNGGGWTQLGTLTNEQIWYQQQYDLSPYLGDNVQFRFTFNSVDSISNGYFGWMVDDVAVFIPGVCSPQAGGLVVGNVYDANTSSPLTGATVSSDSGGATTTGATLDPAVDDSFYILFSPAGSHTFTATMSGGYGPDTATVTVVQSDTVRQDFYLPAVSLSHNPQALQTTLLLGESVTLPFTLTNEGGLPATFELLEYNGGSTTAVLPFASGGPDAFGYTYQDSNEPMGPQFDFVDISTSGTPVSLGDDDYAGPFAIGFDFPFYGNYQTQFFISSNGFLSFGSGSSVLSNDCPLPSTNTPHNIIALMWDDLDPGDTGDLVYYEAFTACPYGAGKCLVVQYDGYHHFPGGGSIAGTWEGILFENGNILIQFEDAGIETGSGSTTGIENASGSDGLTYGTCNTAASLQDSLAICFQYPGASVCGGTGDVPWLSESPITGTIAAGSSQVIDVTFDAGAVTQAGQYYATLHIISSDPTNPIQTVPVTMTVTPLPPTLAITKTGTPNPVQANQLLTYTIVVENTGDGDATGVTITDTVPANTAFSSADSDGFLVGNVVQWTGKLVPAGGSLTVHFVVHMDSQVSNGDTLSNDAYGVTCAEGVSAVGLPIQTTVSAPVLSITKSSYPDPVQAGGLLTYTIVVENTGDADATDAFIVDGIPTNTTFISADSGGTFSEDPGLGDIVNWEDKTIPAGGILTVSFTVRVDSPLPNGTILNNSTYLVAYWGRLVTGSPVQTTVQSAPILDITKSGDRDPIRAGEFLTYTIVVENTGNADATSVTITDTIPATTTFVSADSGGILAGNQVQWSGKTAPAGGTLTVHFTVLVDDQLPNDSIVSNDTYSVTCAEGVSAIGSPVIVHIQNERIIYLPIVVRHY